MITAISPVAKILHSVDEKLNTNNMLVNKTRIATETTARKRQKSDRYSWLINGC